MSVKPSLPKGTRDLLPESMQKRELIFSTIKEVFRKYGFLQIETPAMENLDSLTGKYGEEGDRLIFKVLNSGDYLKKADEKALEEKDSNALTASISNKALRYDLTVPFARFVAQNQNELTFPFKRYQIQPVWRADRPQKGRFREFYQCDADAIGSDSLLLEIEFLQIYQRVFSKLGIEVDIHFNNRKLLAGLAEVLGISERLTEFTVILDKLDKIGREGVEKELSKKAFEDTVAEKLFQVIEAEGNNMEKLSTYEQVISSSDTGKDGIEEMRQVLEGLETSNSGVNPVLDISLARGLDYYTGAIFEVKARGVEIGSIGGGGRYDDLTGIFGLKNISGIGISFGVDRIQMVMEELDLFPAMEQHQTEVLFVNFGTKEALYSLKLADQLRNHGVNAEVYPDPVKLKKQMDFANKKNIGRVVLIGSKEMEAERFVMKDMASGEQQEYSRIELLEFFSKSNANHYGRH